MRFFKGIEICIAYILFAGIAHTFPPDGYPKQTALRVKAEQVGDGAYITSGSHNVSAQLFAELEEFARIVDIAYCVGVTGIYHPFECASRCNEFPGYELVDVRPIINFHP
jgi:hypothetical protein